MTITIRVVLAEDSMLLREGVSRLVEREPNLLDLAGSVAGTHT